MDERQEKAKQHIHVIIAGPIPATSPIYDALQDVVRKECEERGYSYCLTLRNTYE